MPRYKVVEGSQSAHCCFEATVVDTTRPVFFESGKPMMRYNGDHQEQEFEIVCECLSVKDAELVCNALNALTMG